MGDRIDKSLNVIQLTAEGGRQVSPLDQILFGGQPKVSRRS